MKLSTIIASLFISLSLFSTSVAAGWFDNLFNKTTAEKTATAQATQSADLVSSVMSLGLSQTQAEGGLGSLFSLAKTTLGNDSFSSIADAVPNMDGLLSAAPKIDSNSGLTGLLSKTGDLGSAFQGGAQVYDSFEKLGISKELAQPMIEIVKGYLDSYAGDGTSDLLMQGLNSFL